MMWLLACTAGTAPVSVDEDPVSEPSPPLPDTEATQIFDDGTQTCVPQTLADTVVLPLGDTVGDILALMRVERLSPVWFDGRAVDLTVSIVRTGEPVTVDSGCEVNVPVELSLVSDDGAVQQVVVTEADLNDSVRVWVNVDGADWMGLDASVFLAEPCPEGETWRLDVEQGDAESSGSVRHSCDGVQVPEGEPGDGSDDTGTGGTSTGTDTTDTTLTDTTLTDPTLTSTTTLPDDTGGPSAPDPTPDLELLTW